MGRYINFQFIVIPLIVLLTLTFWKSLPVFDLYNLEIEYDESGWITRDDFHAIIKAVKPQVSNFEKLTALDELNAGAVRIKTLQFFSNRPGGIKGQTIILKKENDLWVVYDNNSWVD